MGILDDAIREHLELRRRHGASEAELAKKEAEALSPARREAPAAVAEEPFADTHLPDLEDPAVTPAPEVAAHEESVYAEMDAEPTAHFEAPPADPEPEAALDPFRDGPPPTEAYALPDEQPRAGEPHVGPEAHAGPVPGEPGGFVERILPVEPPDEDAMLVDHVAPVEPPEALAEEPLEQPLDPDPAPLEDPPPPEGEGFEPLAPGPPADAPRPRLRSTIGAAFSRRSDVQTSTPLSPPSTQDFERVEPPPPPSTADFERVEPPAPPSTQDFERVEPPPKDLHDFDEDPEPTTHFEPEPEPPEPEAHPEPEHQGTLQPDSDDMLEETPDFLQETPEHDRLWFEQKPPRDFDFDD